jgi:hypothetical protein
MKEDLETALMSEMSRQISEEIDFELLTDMLIACGWHCVKLPRLLNRKRSIDILEWCEDNVQKKYRHLGNTFVFEDQGDAVNFSLKWS